VRPCERETPAAAVEKHGDAEARRGHGWCAAGVGQPDAIEKVAESLQSPRARRHTACLAELGSVASVKAWLGGNRPAVHVSGRRVSTCAAGGRLGSSAVHPV
jgi:hypothetical protein